MIFNATSVRVRRASVAGALACTLAGASVMSVVTASSSQAADHYPVAVNQVVKSVVMKNRSTPDGPNRVWDNFTMDFSFDTTGVEVAETDTITIQLPSELRTREAFFDVTDKNTGGVAMKCVIPNGVGQTLRCAFTDYADNHINMKGDIHVLADVTRATTSTRFEFKLSHNITLSADIENGNVVPNTDGYAPDTPWKNGWQLHEGHKERFTWEVYIPERNIRSNTISVTDTFDTAHGGYKLFNDPSTDPNAWQRTRLLKWNSLAEFKADPSHQKYNESIPVGGAVNGGTFAMTETSTGFVASFPNSNSDAYYMIKYYTVLNAPENAKPGNVFNNKADVNGMAAEHSIAIDTVGWGDLSGENRPTPPAPSTSTPPATTVTPSPSESTTEATPSPSTSTTPSPKTSLAHTGAMTVPAIGLGALGLALGVALMRRREQASA